MGAGPLQTVIWEGGDRPSLVGLRASPAVAAGYHHVRISCTGAPPTARLVTLLPELQLVSKLPVLYQLIAADDTSPSRCVESSDLS